MRPEIDCWDFVIHALWDFGCIWDIWDIVFIPLRDLWKSNYACFWENDDVTSWTLWLNDLFALNIACEVQGCYTIPKLWNPADFNRSILKSGKQSQK